VRTATLIAICGAIIAGCGSGRLASRSSTTPAITAVPTIAVPTTAVPTTAVPTTASTTGSVPRSSTAPVPSTPAYPTGLTVSSLAFGGRTRTFQVYVPKTLATEPTAIVIQLHGGRGSGARIDALTKFNRLAETESFIVVAPDGVDGNWNDGRTQQTVTAMRENIDDVGFLVAIVDEVARHQPVDRSKVFAAGISNGAMMANRLACERPETFAAVALVSGTGPVGFGANCSNGKHPAVIAFNGTDDPLIPYNGGTGRQADVGPVASVDAIAEFWAKHNGCTGGPTASSASDTISTRTWTCSDGTLVFHRVDGGGHTWPGGTQYLPKLIVGSTDNSVDATRLIWAFFAAH
jgi:polyhydroxybutyrate depolymerase